MTVTARALQGIWERTIEETCRQTFLKIVIDGAVVLFCGRVFHSREPAIGKASVADVRKTGASDNKR